MRYTIDNKNKRIVVGQQSFESASPEEMAVLANYTAIKPKKANLSRTTNDVKKQNGFFAAKKYALDLQNQKK